MESPASLASGTSRCTCWRTSSLIHLLIMFAPPFSSVARDPAGGSSPGRYFPVSRPWAMGEKTIWDMPSETHTGITSPSITRHSIELRLVGDQVDTKVLGEIMAVLDLLGGPLAHPDIERLAHAYDVGERLHGLIERSFVIVAMRLINIDIVGLQPLQGSVDRLHDVLAGQPDVVVSARSSWPVDLGENLQRLTPLALQGFAEHGFGLGICVDICSVEGSDPSIKRGAHAGLGLIVLHLRAECQPVAVGDL